MAAKLNNLIYSARLTAEKRNRHRLREFFSPKGVHTQARAECSRCNATVMVDSRARSNNADIGGTAVNYICPGAD